jgi:hypothetical protein
VGFHKKDISTNPVFQKERIRAAGLLEAHATPAIAVLAVKVEPLRGR